MENPNTPVDQKLPVTRNSVSGKKIIIIAVVVLVVLTLIKSFFFSPERMAEQIMEKATGDDYDVSIDKDGDYSITGKDGENINVNSGKNTKVPDNWPSSVPIPAGVSVSYAAVIAGEAGETTSTLNYSTDENIEKISNLYKEELVANGWTIGSQVSTGDGFMLSATQGEKDFVTVYLSGTNQKTDVTISVQTTK